jgi:2,5-diamino-6-(ribosylamino)-4(3H)-pyrimidinone 5'-phosphate reductase
LVIPDSGGRIRTWHYLRSLPYWRHFVALCSKSKPHDYLHYLNERHIDYLIASEDHVNLRMALEDLYSCYAVRVVRVDAGGILNGLLLRQGLVNEASILIYPNLVGGEMTSSIFRAPNLPAVAYADLASGLGTEGIISLSLMHTEKLQGDVMRLRYEVKR